MLPVLLALCMILTACGTDTCKHTNQELRNVKTATCTEEGYSGDLVCAECGTVITVGTVTPKADHAWGDWDITKQPSATETGSKTHTCTVCGTSETAEIPATGDDVTVREPIESFEDLLDAVFNTALNGESGTLSLTCGNSSVLETLQLTINPTTNGYLAQIAVNIEEDGSTTSVNVYYRDGAFVYEQDGEFFYVSDVDAIVPVEFADLIEFLQLVGAEINEQVEACFAAYDAMIDDLLAAYEDQFDETMASLGLTYKAEDLVAVVSALKNSYAKVCAYFGIETSVTGEGEITLPTREDWLAVCELFMTKEATENGGADYTLDLTPLKAVLQSYTEQLQTICDSTLADVIFALVGPSINPDFEDWDDLEQFIREQISGDMTCGKFIDSLITLVNQSGVCTMKDIYQLIDTIVEAQSGEAFDSEKFLSNYYDLTLDEFVALLFDDSTDLNALYDMASAYLTKTKLGDLVVYHETVYPPIDSDREDSEIMPTEVTMTLSEALAAFGDLLDAIRLDGLGFEFTVDQNDRFVNANLNVDISISSGDQALQLILVSLELKKDATAVITVPAEVEALLSQKVSASYDEAGNLQIGGLDADAEWLFWVDSSSVSIPLTDALKKNAELSEQAGFDIYAVKEEYCGDYDSDTFYTKVDGRFISLNCVKDGKEDYKLAQTKTLSSGAVMYIKEVDGQFTYGYRFLTEDACVWVACYEVDGETPVEFYYGEETELKLYPESIYNLENYTTKNEDGTYTISAEFFAGMDSLVVGEFDSYSIILSGNKDVNDVDVAYRYVVGAHVLFGDISSGLGGTSESGELYIDWFYWFYD